MRTSTRSRFPAAPPIRAVLFLISSLVVVAVALPANATPPGEFRQIVDLIESDDFAAARSALASIRGPDSSGWLDYLHGRLLLVDGDVESAIARLERAVEASPRTAPFHRWLGEAYIAHIDDVSVFRKRGVAKEALAQLQEAARLDPRELGTRETLVGYYLEAPAIVGGGDDKALAEAQSFAGIDPAGGHQLMAQIKLHNEDHQGAIVEYQAAARSRPQDPELRYGLGMALQGQERYEEAFAAFELAIELDPSYMDPYYQLARTAVFAETNLERAIACMRVYLDHEIPASSPGHEHAHWRLGLLYQLQGDRTSARRELEKALELDPDHDEARKALKTLGQS